MWKHIKKEVGNWGTLEYSLACVMAVIAVGMFLVVIKDMMKIEGW